MAIKVSGGEEAAKKESKAEAPKPEAKVEPAPAPAKPQPTPAAERMVGGQVMANSQAQSVGATPPPAPGEPKLPAFMRNNPAALESLQIKKRRNVEEKLQAEENARIAEANAPLSDAELTDAIRTIMDRLDAIEAKLKG